MSGNGNGGTITLRLYGALRQAAGGREVQVAVGEATLGDVLHRFAADHSPQANAMLFDREGNLWRSLILLLNEEPADDGQQTRVQAGDVVSVLLPLAGG
jgi:molybdopterin converting factor small subunit